MRCAPAIEIGRRAGTAPHGCCFRFRARCRVAGVRTGRGGLIRMRCAGCLALYRSGVRSGPTRDHHRVSRSVAAHRVSSSTRGVWRTPTSAATAERGVPMLRARLVADDGSGRHRRGQRERHRGLGGHKGRTTGQRERIHRRLFVIHGAGVGARFVGCARAVVRPPDNRARWPRHRHPGRLHRRRGPR